jgi:hypothetical protein
MPRKGHDASIAGTLPQLGALSAYAVALVRRGRGRRPSTAQAASSPGRVQGERRSGRPVEQFRVVVSATGELGGQAGGDAGNSASILRAVALAVIRQAARRSAAVPWHRPIAVSRPSALTARPI